MGTLKFEYTIDDVKKEFKELLDGTSNFGRSDAEFTVDEFKFKIEQIASCTAQLVETDENLKEAISFIEKTNFEGFDPRYESRFNSKETFELDRMLQNILKKYTACDDDLNHFILFQALKHYKGMSVDDFEIRISKEDSNSLTQTFFDYLKEDFDYIELDLDDADMADFAESTYNDGTNNFAVFSRKAFEEYLCGEIIDEISQKLSKKNIEGSVPSIEQKLFTTILDSIPDVQMKYSQTLIDGVNSISKKLKPVSILSFNARDLIANEFFANWIPDYLAGNGGISGLERKLKLEHATADFTPYSNDVQKTYKRWLKDGKISDVKDLIDLSGVKPSRDVVAEFYKDRFRDAKFKDIRKFMLISGLKLADMTSDPEMLKELQNAYKIWLSNNSNQNRYRDSYQNSYSDLTRSIDTVKKGIRISKVKPDNDTMQKFYKNMLVNGWLDNAEEVIGFTAIKPEKEAVSDFYINKFSNSNFRDLRRVMRFTGIPFSHLATDENMQKEIQKIYRNWIASFSFDALEEGMELSNLKPDKDMVLKFYRDMLDNNKLDNVEDCIEVTHILPDEETMLNYYKVGLNYNNFSNIERSIQFSKVKPSNKIMQDFYKNRLNNNKLGDVEDGVCISDIKPEPDSMLNFYTDRIKSDDLDSVEEGERISDITLVGLIAEHPDMSKVMQNGYKKWLGFRNLDMVQNGIRLSKVLPEKDIMFDFYKNRLEYAGRGGLDEIAEGMEISRVMPDETLMSGFFKSWLDNDLFNYVEKAINITKVKLDKKTLLDFYKDRFRRCRLTDIKEGMKATGTNIRDFTSDAGLSKDIQDTYRKWLKDRWFSDTKSGIEITGVKPEDAILQEFYKEKIENGRLDDVEAVADITGIKPNKNIMSGFFMSCFENDEMPRFERGVKFSDSSPDSETMSGFYNKWFRDAKFDTITRSAKASKVKPDYQAMHTDVQSAYKSWLDNGKLNLVEEGIGLTKIKPEANLMQNFYTLCFEKGSFDSISNGEKISDVEADYTAMENKVQESYRKWFKNCWLDYIKKGIKASKIEPDYPSMIEDIQSGYQNGFNNHYFDYVGEIITLSKIKPAKKIMSDFYRECMDKGRLDYVEAGIRLSDVKPGKDIMPDAYRMWFEYDRIDLIEKGIKLSGLEPNYNSMVSEIQDGYIRGFRENRFDNIKRTVTLTSIKPNKNVMDRFYNTWIKNGQFDLVERAIELSGIVPDYASMADELHEGYERDMDTGDFENITRGVRLTGIKPPATSIFASKAKDTLYRTVGLR